MHPTTTDISAAPNDEVSLGLRAWAFQLGWVQISLVVLLATPAFVLGAVSGGIYGASLCTVVWLALRMADEDAAWSDRDALDRRP